MLIYEVDDRALAVKLKALIDHPSTNDNMRAIAKQRYDALMLQGGGGKLKGASERWAPKITAASPSGYPLEVSSSNWNRQFINRDGRHYTFFQMIGKVRNAAPDEIEFLEVDQQANNLNAHKVVFAAHKRPAMVQKWTEAAPGAEHILDALRQLTQHDWSVKAQGRNTIVITYIPDADYTGDRKSS